VATFAGSPTDLAVSGQWMGVIDGGNGSGSNASIFQISPEGEVALQFTLKIPNPINGAAIIN
jgi:hypothetical protein